MLKIGLDRQICAELQQFATFAMFFLQISKIIVIRIEQKDFNEWLPYVELVSPRDVTGLKEIVLVTET